MKFENIGLRVQARGGANIYDAAQEAIGLSERLGGIQVVFLFNDIECRVQWPDDKPGHVSERYHRQFEGSLEKS